MHAADNKFSKLEFSKAAILEILMELDFLKYKIYCNSEPLYTCSQMCMLQSSGPEFIKLFSCSAQLSLKFILPVNVKMPTIVGILTFMSRINYKILSFDPDFNICEQLKFHAQLS